MWESIPPTTTFQITASQKRAWSQIAIGVKTTMNVIKYTDFEWAVRSPDEAIDTSYPRTDNTLNRASGNYLLMTAQSPQKVADRAVIVSDHYDIDGNRSFCLSFFYYLKSSSSPSFHLEIFQSEAYSQVYKIAEIVSTKTTFVWTKFNVTAKAKNSSSTNMWFYLVCLIIR